jgi:hypothetical protein
LLGGADLKLQRTTSCWDCQPVGFVAIEHRFERSDVEQGQAEQHRSFRDP